MTMLFSSLVISCIFCGLLVSGSPAGELKTTKSFSLSTKIHQNTIDGETLANLIANGNVSIDNFANVKQKLNNVLGMILTVDANIGTPAQAIPLEISLTSTDTFVINKNTCKQPYCSNSKLFSPSDSTSFVPDSSNAVFKSSVFEDGTYGTDQILIGTLNTKQMFGLVGNKNAEALKDDATKDNAVYPVLSLALTSLNPNVKTYINNIMDQLDEKFVVLSVQSDSAATIAFGTKDTANCQDSWTFNDIVSGLNPPQWFLNVGNLEWGKDVNVKDAGYVAFEAIGMTMIPIAYVKKMTDLKLANPGFLNEIDCNLVPKLAPLKFTIGGKVYQVPSSGYTFKLVNKCFLMATPSELGNVFIVGNSFLKSTCIALKPNAGGTPQIGLAASKNGSPSLNMFVHLTGSLLAVWVSLYYSMF